jgi:hypothetical protein
MTEVVGPMFTRKNLCGVTASCLENLLLLWQKTGHPNY